MHACPESDLCCIAAALAATASLDMECALIDCANLQLVQASGRGQVPRSGDSGARALSAMAKSWVPQRVAATQTPSHGDDDFWLVSAGASHAPNGHGRKADGSPSSSQGGEGCIMCMDGRRVAGYLHGQL